MAYRISEHTPGPWIYRKHLYDPIPHCHVCGEYQDQHHSPQVPWYLGHSGGNSKFLCDLFFVEDGHDEDNIRLIATAPDLLEALKVMVSTIEGFPDMAEEPSVAAAMRCGRNALAKVEGKGAARAQ